jgi:cytochrome c-type biogenesis protein CcmF
VVCPILSWGKTEGSVFWQRARWPLGIGAALSAAFIGIWYTSILPNYMVDPKRANSLKALKPYLPVMDHTEAVIALLVAGFAVALPLYLFVDGARRRAASKGESIGASLLAILSKSRTQSGGYITHLGIGIILVGLVGSAMYVNDKLVTIPQKPDSKFKAGGYEFLYKGAQDTKLANGDVDTVVMLDVMRGGTKVGTLRPGQLQYALQGQTRQNADVRTEFLRDVFVVFQGATDTEITFNVKVNPMISWTWFGFALTVLGSALAAWPRKQAA